VAKTLTRAVNPGLYEQDFYVWTRKQADLLRAGRFDELDLPHLIDEVEDLGASQRRDAFSRSQQILQHLLKLQFSAAVEPRAGWQQIVEDQRDELELVLTPTLCKELEQILPARYARCAGGQPRILRGTARWRVFRPIARTLSTRSSMRTGCRRTCTA
jgi:Domain of unknown function DUF29